jgi:RNA polymerase sigma factor (sigma-70 family)
LNRESEDHSRNLVEAARAGDRKAQYGLYDAYAKAMFNICCRMMNNTAEAQDLLQDSFVDAFRRLDSFRFESSFGAWLKRIVINHCINALEKRRIVFSREELPEQPDETDHGPDEEDLRLSVEKVRRAMNRLPEGARVIFSLYLIEGYDHTEIAEILRISESTSKTQFMRARQLVKEMLTGMSSE